LLDLLNSLIEVKKTVEAKTWLNEEFPNSAPGKSTIIDWYAKFKRVEMSTNAVGAQKSLLPTKTSKKITK